MHVIIKFFNFQYHFIVSHFINAIRSTTMLIVHLIYKKIFIKIPLSKKIWEGQNVEIFSAL